MAGEMVDRDADALVHATGLAVSLFGSLLERAEILPRGEFSHHLALLARVAAETDPRVGTILRGWTAMAARVDPDRPI
jgi:hypothetical protein